MRAALRAVVALLLPWLAAACAGDTKILQWRWDTSYITGGWAPTYQRVGWGMWMPIGGFPPTLVRQGCIVEWTVAKGNTQSYRWQGSGCNTVTIHATQPPG